MLEDNTLGESGSIASRSNTDSQNQNKIVAATTCLGLWLTAISKKMKDYAPDWEIIKLYQIILTGVFHIYQNMSKHQTCFLRFMIHRHSKHFPKQFQPALFSSISKKPWYQCKSSSKDRAITHLRSARLGSSILKQYTAKALKTEATMQALPGTVTLIVFNFI